MATLAQIRQQVRLSINQADGTGDFSNSELNGFINEGNRFLAVLVNWPRDRVEVQVEQGTPGYTLPKDCISLLLSYFGKESESGDKLPLTILSEEQLSSIFPNWMATDSGSQGRPKYLTLIDKKTAAIYPSPDSDESVTGKKLEIVYSFYPATLTDDGQEPELPPLYHDFLSQYGTYKCYMGKLNNPQLGQAMLGEIIDKAKLTKSVVTKELNIRGFVWGNFCSPDEDYDGTISVK